MSKQATSQDFNQRRQVLGEILPLKMPLSVQIQVTNLCNFKCFYGRRDKYPFCKNCKMFLNQLLPSGQLDAYREDLTAKYTALLADAEKQNGAKI